MYAVYSMSETARMKERTRSTSWHLIQNTRGQLEVSHSFSVSVAFRWEGRTIALFWFTTSAFGPWTLYRQIPIISPLIYCSLALARISWGFCWTAWSDMHAVGWDERKRKKNTSKQKTSNKKKNEVTHTLIHTGPWRHIRAYCTHKQAKEQNLDFEADVMKHIWSVCTFYFMLLCFMRVTGIFFYIKQRDDCLHR